MVPFSLTLCDP